jgi:bacillithiol system protein YtxJ
MDWNKLTSPEQVEKLDAESRVHAVLIYKHSTRCGICATALGRLERKYRGTDAEKLKPYYLDVLKHKELSEAIADKYGVEHESPQALVIVNGKCVLVQNHMQISYDDLMAAA